MAMLSWQSRGRQAERVWEMEAGRVQRERESEGERERERERVSSRQQRVGRGSPRGSRGPPHLGVLILLMAAVVHCIQPALHSSQLHKVLPKDALHHLQHCLLQAHSAPGQARRSRVHVCQAPLEPARALIH
jgi:hypothetical protein